MTERNADDRQIKVTDKRMFTAEGDLRDEYRDLATGSATAEHPTAEATPPPAQTAGPASPPATSAAAPGMTGARPQPAARPGAGAAPSQATGIGETPKGYPSGAQFEDLVALLAQTTVTFLQQASRPQGRTESLEQAQLYLDLLGILDDKTTGNLASQEQAMLQDALRQLRLAFARHG